MTSSTSDHGGKLLRVLAIYCAATVLAAVGPSAATAMPTRLWTRVGAIAPECRLSGPAALRQQACAMLEASIGASSPYPLTRTPGPSDVTMRLTGSVQAAGAGGLLTAFLQATRPPIEGETPETTRALAVRTAMEPAALRAALDDAVRRLVPRERKGG